MENKFFCCINLWIEQDSDLQKWIYNFEDDTEFLKDSIYLNLLNASNNSEFDEIIDSFVAKYPKNASAYLMPNSTYAVCYNAMQQNINQYEFVNYTNTAVMIKASDIKKMRSHILSSKKKLAAWSFYPYAIQPNGKKMPYLHFRSGNFHCSNSNYDKFSMYLPGYLIRTDVVTEKLFNEETPDDSDILFLIRAIFDCKDYMLTKLPLISDEPSDTDFYNYRRQFRAEWYTETLKKGYLPYLKKHPRSPFIKAMVMYQIGIRFACNRNDRSKNILLDKQLDQFFDTLTELLNHISDNIIVSYNLNNAKMLPKYMGLVFLRIKYKKVNLYPTIANNGGKPNNYIAVHKNALVDTKKTLKLSVTCMDYNKSTKELTIDGKLTNASVFNYDKIRCFAHFGGHKKAVERTDIYSLEKYFGISMYRDYTFRVRLTADDLKKSKGSIIFKFRYGDLNFKLPIIFSKMESHLTNKFPHSYWQFGKYMMTYDSKKNALCLASRDKWQALKQEFKLYGDFLRFSSKKGRKRAIKSILLRLAYLATRPIYRRKQVWITFDQLFKGGDNGEYFFRYVADNHSDLVNMYYVANPDCSDYQHLKEKYGKKRLLPFNSVKEKITALHANCVFATRVDVKQYCGYNSKLEVYFRGLLNYDVFCLQHGLTIQRIAQYQNRLFDNTKLYFCVSPNEVENLSHPVYGYDPDVLLLTGAPRYDGLVNRDQKQLLIAPTWRRNVTAGTNKKGHQHEYSINFKETEYYHIYNGLINNQKLIECAKETGYRIVYLVHPILSPQVKDFHAPEQVTIVAGADGNISYEKMMCESSLMLTDHSGIQFDFASMRKPLIYYHPDSLPPQYDAGGMDYETQAFGPVCKNEEEVVNALCDAMHRQCEMEDEYRARADKFFAFSDHNNCKRVFEAAAEHQRLNINK